MNLRQILQSKNLSPEKFEQDLERQFPRETTDYTYIEHFSEWKHTDMPEFLTNDYAKGIYAEAEKLREELLTSEQVRIGREFVEDEGHYVTTMALDLKLLQYGVTDCQLMKKIVEINEIDTNNEASAQGSEILKADDDLRSTVTANFNDVINSLSKKSKNRPSSASKPYSSSQNNQDQPIIYPTDESMSNPDDAQRSKLRISIDEDDKKIPVTSSTKKSRQVLETPQRHQRLSSAQKTGQTHSREGSRSKIHHGMQGDVEVPYLDLDKVSSPININLPAK